MYYHLSFKKRENRHTFAVLCHLGILIPCLHLVVLLVGEFSAIWPKLNVVVAGLPILIICGLALKLVTIVNINLLLGASEHDLESNPLAVDVCHEGLGIGAVIDLELSILEVKHDGGLS